MGDVTSTSPLSVRMATAMPPKPPGRLNVQGWFVYILWGDDRLVPLYVGQTSRVLRRLGEHAFRFGPELRDVELIACRNQVESETEEQRLIEFYRPPYNLQGNPDFRRRACAHCDEDLPPGVHAHRRYCDNCVTLRVWQKVIRACAGCGEPLTLGKFSYRKYCDECHVNRVWDTKPVVSATLRRHAV